MISILLLSAIGGASSFRSQTFRVENDEVRLLQTDGLASGDDGKCNRFAAKPIVQIYILDASKSIIHTWSHQWDAAKTIHSGFKDAYNKIGDNEAQNYMHTGMLQFSGEGQVQVISEVTDDTNIFDNKKDTFKPFFSNTFYQKPLAKCVEMMKLAPELINGKKPEKVCILMTDGFPMDCGGKKDMFPEITQPLVSGTTTAEECKTQAAAQGIKIQTIFLQASSVLPDFNQKSLAILATISSCDDFTEVNPPSSGLEKEIKGIYNSGEDCPYLRAAISKSTAAYTWLTKQADALVDAVLEPVSQLCPVNYQVKDKQCVKCPPNSSRNSQDDRCLADTECTPFDTKPCESETVDHHPVAVVYVVDFSNSVKSFTGKGAITEDLQAQFEVMRKVHSGFESVYKGDGLDPQEMMMTSMVSFSNDKPPQHHVFENQAARTAPGFTSSPNIIDTIWGEKGSAWTPEFGITMYRQAVQEAYRLLKEKIPADFLAKDPVLLAVLITDGAPQDCGGTKAMQPTTAKPYVRDDSNKAQCADTLNAVPSKLLSLYMSLDDSFTDPVAQMRLKLLSELSGCGDYGNLRSKGTERWGYNDLEGRKNGESCNYFFATRDYTHIEKFVPRFIETVTKVTGLKDQCPQDFKVRNKFCVACTDGRKTNGRHDRCGKNTTCIGDGNEEQEDPETPEETAKAEPKPEVIPSSNDHCAQLCADEKDGAKVAIPGDCKNFCACATGGAGLAVEVGDGLVFSARHGFVIDEASKRDSDCLAKNASPVSSGGHRSREETAGSAPDPEGEKLASSALGGESGDVNNISTSDEDGGINAKSGQQGASSMPPVYAALTAVITLGSTYLF